MSFVDVRTEPFRRHYETEDSHWGGHSGGGSSPLWNIEYRSFLERFIRINNVKSVVDIGCGDWQFSRFIDWSGVRYRGYDVVRSVIDTNTVHYGCSTISFHEMPSDLGEVAPADLLVMKDVLQHLPDAEIMRFRNELFERFPSCLITNSYQKIETPQNIDIEFGQFRSLDLNAAPYHFGGIYVLEYSSPLWERLRTMLYARRSTADAG